MPCSEAECVPGRKKGASDGEPSTRDREPSSGYMQVAPGDGESTMEKTTLIKIGKIAIAIALSFVICGIAVRPALADDHHHGGGGD